MVWKIWKLKTKNLDLAKNIFSILKGFMTQWINLTPNLNATQY